MKLTIQRKEDKIGLLFMDDNNASRNLSLFINNNIPRRLIEHKETIISIGSRPNSVSLEAFLKSQNIEWNNDRIESHKKNPTKSYILNQLQNAGFSFSPTSRGLSAGSREYACYTPRTSRGA